MLNGCQNGSGIRRLGRPIEWPIPRGAASQQDQSLVALTTGGSAAVFPTLPDPTLSIGN